MSSRGKRPELEIRAFEDQPIWGQWLAANHETSLGVWIRMAKKDSGIASVSHAEALDVALCYGWIDAQVRRYDERTYLLKFCPRGPKSIWSKINRARVQQLIEAGRMQRAGHAAIASAKRDRRWHAAYDSQRNATVPPDLCAALDANPRAKAFFDTLTSQNRYAILFRVHTTKTPATRAVHIRRYVTMLAAGKTLHPQPRRVVERVVNP